jgi:hypothetical protein
MDILKQSDSVDQENNSALETAQDSDSARSMSNMDIPLRKLLTNLFVFGLLHVLIYPVRIKFFAVFEELSC